MKTSRSSSAYDADTMNLIGLPQHASEAEIIELTKLPSLGFSPEMAKRTLRTIRSPGHRVLDLACGLGTASVFFALNYGCTVVGLDICAAFLAEARYRTELSGLGGQIKFIRADLRLNLAVDLNWPDLVVASSTGRLFGSASDLLAKLMADGIGAGTLVLWQESRAFPLMARSSDGERLERQPGDSSQAPSVLVESKSTESTCRLPDAEGAEQDYKVCSRSLLIATG